MNRRNFIKSRGINLVASPGCPTLVNIIEYDPSRCSRIANIDCSQVKDDIKMQIYILK